MKEPKEICQRMLYFYDNLETTGWQVLCLKEPTNEEDENAVAVVSTNSHFIQEVVGNE